MSKPLLRVLRCKTCRGRGWYNSRNSRGWIITIICEQCAGRGTIKVRSY